MAPTALGPAVAVLQHYFETLDLLAPEAPAEPLAGAEDPPTEGGPLDGLTAAQAEAAYRALAKILHPDMGGGHEAFVRLQRWMEGQRSA